MDVLDKIIHKCATALHEGRRQQAVERRHEKDREAKIRRDLDQLQDRILLHFPPTKRDARPDLSDKQFQRLQKAEAAHRTQLFLMLVREMALDDEMPKSDLDF